MKNDSYLDPLRQQLWALEQNQSIIRPKIRRPPVVEILEHKLFLHYRSQNLTSHVTLIALQPPKFIFRNFEKNWTQKRGGAFLPILL